MALAARIAPPQGVAFHTSTDAAPAERGAKHCNVFLRFQTKCGSMRKDCRLRLWQNAAPR